MFLYLIFANDFIYGGKLGGIYEIDSGEIEVAFKVDRVSYKFDGGDLDSTNYSVYLGSTNSKITFFLFSLKVISWNL